MEAWLSAITDEVLETLPLAQREVVRLARDERLSEAEIADRLAISQGTVASRLFRARMAVNVRPKDAPRATSAKKTKEKAAAPVVALPTLNQVTKDLDGLRSLEEMLSDDTAAPASHVPLPTLRDVEKDVKSLRSLESLLDESADVSAAGKAPLPTLDQVTKDLDELRALQRVLQGNTDSAALAMPLPTLENVEKDLEGLRALQDMLDATPASADAPSAAKNLPLLSDVEKDLARLEAIKDTLEKAGKQRTKAGAPAADPNAAILRSIADDRARLASLQAMLDEAANEPEPVQVPDVATIRSQIEENIPGYMAAVKAAEQQLRQAKVRLATA